MMVGYLSTLPFPVYNKRKRKGVKICHRETQVWVQGISRESRIHGAVVFVVQGQREVMAAEYVNGLI